MSPEGSRVAEDRGRFRRIGIWVGPLVVLVGLWLWLAFSSGGYTAEQWLPPSLVLGFFGAIVSLLAAYPRRPRQLSLAILALFACYTAWVALSAAWAASATRVWMETGRTLGYLLLFALALVYFTDPAARRAFRYLLLAASLVLLAACVWQLWTHSSIVGLFIDNRFSYPVSYPNNAGALFLVGFWPLMWLAAGPEERASIRGAALGLATGLLGLAIMTQSRGALWSLGISLLVMFAVSPARMRTFVYLLVPALLMVYEFPKLNRYWLEGPAAVGGSIGARTLVVTVLTATFIGTILALLERWIKVGRKTRTAIGTVVLLAALAGSVYGVFAFTSDTGGPSKWLSRTWQEFSGKTEAQSDSTQESRFTMISSSGRVDIWRVAWEEFQSAPVLGVGADNFVFQYDRLRSREVAKPQQAHSLELQILGETGAVGGIFAFGGILLALAGLLWPRCTAGWLGARDSWLHRRDRNKGQERDRVSTANVPPETGKVRTRWCNPRWGTNPAAYGWEMALLAGAAYWLIHASVDWLWQMAGVSIPALLFVAAGVAGVDARVGVLWPRVRRRLRTGAPADAGVSPVRLSESKPETSTGSVAGRRDRPGILRRRSAERIQPPELLSVVFKALLVTLSLAVMITAGLPYLSLQLQKSAVALAGIDGVRAVERAGSARFLLPNDPRPYLTQAGIYSRAASAAAASPADDRAGAVLDNLALSIERFEMAIAQEPADWSLHYRAGVMALNLLLARDYASGVDPGLDYETLIPVIPGLEDWSGLLGSAGDLPGPGTATGSLASDAEAIEKARRSRELSPAALTKIAEGFLVAAQERNPMAGQPAAALEIGRYFAGD